MNKRIIFYNLGRLVAIAGTLLIVPAVVSLLYRDGCFVDFLIPAVMMLVFGILCSFRKPKDRNVYAREGFATVTLMWIAFSAFGALPFVLSGTIPSFVDAFFETVSGFTTTGSTILTDVESLPPSMQFWRSFTHWAGGMGVLALAIALTPGDPRDDQADSETVHLLKAETPGPTFGKLVARLRHSVRIIYAIYTGMTVLMVVMLCLGGMSLFDSLINTFGTAGTGGFSHYNASIAHYDSLYYEMVIAVFMVLFGVNFTLYYFILTGKVMKFFRSEEFRWYIAIIVGATLLISWNTTAHYGGFFTALRYAFFQVASIISTSGFVSSNFDLWPIFSQVILVLLMFVGGCVGSTAGGLKVTRILILVKNSFRALRREINPREVRVVRFEGQALKNGVVHAVSAYFCVYMLILLGSTLLLSLNGRDMTTTLTAVITCLNNVGPGLNEVGAVGNFSAFSPLAKLLLSFDMLAGRLEIFPMLVALSPSVWKRTL